jgi:hypothetical protein
MQGRLLGAPMPPAELETLLAESLPHTGRLVRSAARILGWPAR